MPAREAPREITPVASGRVSTPLAATASAWSPAPLSRLRLLNAGGLDQPGADGARGGRHLAAIEIALAPGAKTYWRDPGETGLAPRFDWAGSINLAAIELRWPAPRQFNEGGSRAVGYAEDLVLPLIATPTDPTRPITLVLTADYGACTTLCVPSRGTARLALPVVAQSSPHRSRVMAALSRVPVLADGTPGSAQGGADKLYALMRSLHFSGVQAAYDSVVVWAWRACGAPLDVMVEGPAGWSFGPVTVPSCEGASGTARAVLPVRTRPPGASLSRLPITITLVAGETAIEQALRLDAVPSAP